MPGRRSSRRPPVAAVLALVVLLVLPVAAGAEPTSEELRRELERTVAEAERRALELDQLERQLASAEDQLVQVGLQLDDARARLVAAEGQVMLAELALADAQGVQAAAEAAHTRAEELRAAAEAELAAQEAVFTNQVVEGFKYGSVGGAAGSAMLELLRRAEDPMRFAVGMRHLQIVVDEQGATVDRVTALRRERAAREDDAARARGEAVQAALAAADTLTVVTELRAEAEELAAQVARDEERQLALVEGLRGSAADVQAALDRVDRRRAELRTAFEEQRRREEEARRREEERARRIADGGRSGLPGAAGGPGLPGGMVCPVLGAVAGRDVINDWGFPRSGGRTHEGNDIFAARGTPVVAVGDGVVVRMNGPGAPTRLGGITLTYRTSDGSEWYNAHLDAIAPGLSVGSAVAQGETVGTVGNTGNARTTPPHLHLGRRYAGSWVNPWPQIAAVCR